MEVAELRARIGQPLGTSAWLTVDQPRIDAFAACTEDRNAMHVDPQAAAKGPFGGTIAHGFLTLSLLAPAAEAFLTPLAAGLRVNYGFDRVRFLAPVPAGARVRARFRLLGLDETAAPAWTARIEAIMDIEHADRPALVAEWLIHGRP